MRAVGLMRHGGPEVLEIVEVPEEHAGPGQVRIKVQAAAVNPTDTMARNGSRAEQQKVDPPPYVPGMDAAGIVPEDDIDEDEEGMDVTLDSEGEERLEVFEDFLEKLEFSEDDETDDDDAKKN